MMKTRSPARTVLARLVQERRWTVEDFRAQYAKAAEGLGLNLTVSERQTMRWFTGNMSGLPYPAACRVLEHMFGRQVGELLAVSPGTPCTSVSVASPVPGSPLVPARRSGMSGMEDVSARAASHRPEETEFVMSAARESGEHAMFAAAGNLDVSSVEQLAEDVRRLAHAHATTPPFQLFTELARTRNTVYVLLERTRRPRQLNDLFTIAGQVCGLLGVASLDLGYPDAGVENARAAWAYGQIVEDDGLRSWSRAVQATIAFWSGRPREGVDLTHAGLGHARPGSGEVRLHAVQARAYAVLGAVDEAMAALAAAERAAETDASDDLLDVVGGEFAFGAERRLLSAASTHLALGQLERAEHAAMVAVDLFADIPLSDRWVSGEYGAHTDLVTVRTLRGEIDGAEDALAPVLALPADQRTRRLAGRLHDLRRSLSRPRYCGSAEARRLDEQIELFVRDSAPAAVPPGLSHHPGLGDGDG
jgi:hypothetical protein